MNKILKVDKNLTTMNISCNLNGCIIEDLLITPFSRRNIENQTAIKKCEQPRPDLSDKLFVTCNIKNKVCKRHFQKSYYDKHVWLSACEKLNKMFCWWCLLFATERGVWTTGFDN